MSFSFENQGTHTYLVYTVAGDDMVDTMSLGMITNNKIPGLAHTIFTQMDTTRFIKYDVSAKISVKQFFAGQVNKKRLLGVFNGIVDAMLSAEEYMIDVNSILLDLEYIFADVSTCDTVLVCLPLISDDLRGRDLGAFFKTIMFSAQFDQAENCDYVTKILNYLNSTPVLSLEEFKKLLESLEEPAQTTTMQPIVKTAPVVQQPQETARQPQPAVQKNPAKPTPAPQKPAANMPVPQIPNVQSQPKQVAVPEKKITMMELLMHYSKENVEKYKAQKSAGKENQGKQPSAARAKNQPSNAGFPIPGQSTPVNQGMAIPGQQTSIQPAPQKTTARPAQPVASAAPAQQPIYTPAEPRGQSMNFGETTVLGGGGIGETTVLGVAPVVQAKPYLIRVKNNEKINLDKPVFRIGKERSYVDYFIADNSAISRSHANVISRDGEYFVMDTNSTNHTYVDGQMIQSNVETKIVHGAKIRLANEDFEFKLY